MIMYLDVFYQLICLSETHDPEAFYNFFCVSKKLQLM